MAFSDQGLSKELKKRGQNKGFSERPIFEAFI